MSLAGKIIAFIRQLKFNGQLPEGIRLMNPYLNQQVFDIASGFYHKYYNDDRPRKLILGINPGRFGGGVTGIPFTDTKRLQDVCGIPFSGKETHEPSSVFVYKVIGAYGGPEAFYSDFYIGAVCPLGFTKVTGAGKEVNYNYYDDRALTEAVYEFIKESLQEQFKLGMDTQTCFCLGTGKNYKFLLSLNNELKLFKNIIPLDHPRFIMQYRAKELERYTDAYIRSLKSVTG